MESTTTPQVTTSTEQIINRYTIYAGLAGLIPTPMLDLALVAYIQFDMVKQLSQKYNVDFSEFKKKALIVSAGGSILARIGAVWIKAMPFFGSILGGLSMAATSAASTYALGKLIEAHFEKGGSPSTFNLKAYRGEFERLREEGKRVIQGQKQTPPATGVVNLEKQSPVENFESEENATMKLEGLEQMYADGVITKEEYETTKARILAAR